MKGGYCVLALFKIREIVTAVTATILKRKCSICRDRLGVLHCDDDSWICGTCAQMMGELADD